MEEANTENEENNIILFPSPIIRPHKRKNCQLVRSKAVATKEKFPSGQRPDDGRAIFQDDGADAESDSDSQKTYFSGADEISQLNEDWLEKDFVGYESVKNNTSFTTFTSLETENEQNDDEGKNCTQQTQTMLNSRKRPSKRELKMLRRAAKPKRMTNHDEIVILESQLSKMQHQLSGKNVPLEQDEVVDVEATISEIDEKIDLLGSKGSRSEKMRLQKITAQFCNLKDNLRKSLNTEAAGTCSTKQPIPAEVPEDKDLPSLKVLMDADLLNPGESNLSLRLPTMRLTAQGSLRADASIVTSNSQVYSSVEDWCRAFSSSTAITGAMAFDYVRYNRKENLTRIWKSLKERQKQESQKAVVNKKLSGRPRPRKSLPVKERNQYDLEPESPSFDMQQFSGALTSVEFPGDLLTDAEKNDPIVQIQTGPINLEKSQSDAGSNNYFEVMESNQKTPSIWEIAEIEQEKIFKIWKDHVEFLKQKHILCEPSSGYGQI
ncbi:Hypothetical predicted protein [Cloeon dipterum]|uniref:RAMA domain-containing protein n=2 Tax=Cloeon dipterum TaxID=197152 RepID=A0A8S1CS77_9INSE|nr:Hypothetical predicted protein [Cloeon dipterum]